MHRIYLAGGAERNMAPQVIYAEAACPHDGCSQRLQAIDFPLGDFGPPVDDPLVRAWWNDTGFAGRCPACDGWVHFTVRAKLAIRPEEAAKLPRLPDNWAENATIL